jgi:hypothetical protein
VWKEAKHSLASSTPAALMRERIARRAAAEFTDGMYGILCREWCSV